MSNSPPGGRASLKVIHPVTSQVASPISSPAETPARAPRAARKSPPVTQAPKPGSTQRIVDSITAAIVERRLMPGTKLSEQKIADIFKVSRTLVRQALNQLSRDRLVVLEPARGAFVEIGRAHV